MRAWLQQLAELRKVLTFLRPYLVQRPLMLAAVLASSLFVMLFEGFGVGLLVPLLNLLLGGERATPMRPLQWLESMLPGHSPAFYIGAIAASIVGAIALKNLAYYTSLVFTSTLKRHVAITLRDDLFRQLQRADLDLFDRMPGGDLANVFLVETYRTTQAVDTMLALVQRSSVAFFYVAALFVLSWPLTSLVVVLAIALGVALSFIYGRLKRVGIELTELNHRLSSTVAQAFSGIRIVRATHSQDREIDRFHRANRAQADAELRSAEALSLVFPITETLAVAGAMVIVTCAYIFLVRPGYMLSSYLLAYGFILLRLLPLLNQLYQLHAHLAYLAGGINEVKAWLDTPQFPDRPFGTTPFAGLQRELRFEKVDYRYPNGRVALAHIDFTVPVGRTVAIVGPSGAGKSTLASILLRFRAPSAGRILVDGRDHWDFTPESWHRATALVEQDAFLFHGTLRENILYGCDSAGEEALRAAVTAAHLDDVIAALPDGLETLVGERGAMVSGGQRQRIAIARALIRNPSILILDEATSHLDAVSERLVQQALQNAARGRTTIVIAHRLSTIRDADLLIVLEHGRIVEQGTWATLASAGGTFERLIQGMGA
ncbi:MAG TPA: ABC transporter ATP-binding protein [Vicinamibacterales bacterium]|nr:ABC transporter ATP-binding protein [Vicinamibacterales bacterium]